MLTEDAGRSVYGNCTVLQHFSNSKLFKNCTKLNNLNTPSAMIIFLRFIYSHDIYFSRSCLALNCLSLSSLDCLIEFSSTSFCDVSVYLKAPCPGP